METKIIKQFISQQVTGYSADFKTTYVQSLVEYTDGTTGTIQQSYPSPKAIECNPKAGQEAHGTE